MFYIISARDVTTGDVKISYELSGITEDLSYATLLSNQFAMQCQNELLGAWEGHAAPSHNIPCYNTQ
jgi:hypothetical protein